MSIKEKFSREQKAEKDRANNRNLLLVVVLITVGLMGVMYFAFGR